MKKILLLLTSTILSTQAFSQLTYSWVESLKLSTANGASVRGIEASSNGNVYIMGNFSTTIDFDPSSSNFFLSPNVTSGCFLAKYSSSGNFIWAKEIVAETVNFGYEAVNDFVIDANENIYITGAYEKIVDFDPSPATYTLGVTQVGSRYAFTAKYNSSGNLVWVQDIPRGDIQNGADLGMGVKIELDGNANVYVGAQVLKRPFICKYSNAGNMLWKDSLISSSLSSPSLHGFHVNSSGEVFVSGVFLLDIDMDPGAGISLMSATLANFLGKYTTNGTLVWNKKLNTLSQSEKGMVDITSDGSGNVYTCGIGLNGTMKNLVTKWDNSGNLQWMNFFNYIANQGCSDIYISCNNEIIVTGLCNNGQNFDPLGGTYTCTPNSTPGFIGLYFNFVASYNVSNGGIIWAKCVGGDLNSNNTLIINNGNTYSSIPVSNSFIDNLGNVYLCGNLTPYSSVSNDFDPDLGIVTLNSNTDKSFFAKYTGCGIVDIEDNKSINSISIFPNPSTSQFNFSGLVGENTIQITDIMGRALLTEKTYTENHTLKLDAAQGIYFYKITDKKNRVQQGKLILN